jgi:tetratricopeptide (TPR) repeat protein/tRNA A-37 threonylcarbamoyl transferase component Bud32
MGVVYRARDTVLEREVALKLIRPEVAGDEEVRNRFLREARLAAAINHPGVATLYEAGEAEPDGDGEAQLYLASELVAGKSLDSVLHDGPLPVDRVIEIGCQLAEALEAAHTLGIVHRDIKPSNLMVTPEGQLKVLDFGVAKRVEWAGPAGEDASTLTFTARGAVVGTPAYMAPEQVAGSAADARTDIHGAGCVLYQMLTGKGPFGSGSPSEVMRRVIVTPPKPLRAIRTEVPRGLADVVEKALAKEPADRFRSATELAESLRASAESTGVRDALRGLGRRVPKKIGVAAVLVLVIVISMLAGRKLLGTAIAFDERDWLLVADVVNDTDDEGFTLALKSALETDLRQSRHVNVFDAGQVRNTLKMMRRDQNATVDLDTGLEMCRFAGVRALLVPQINAMGDVYILQASLVDPSTGRTADRVRLTAAGRDEVLLESIDTLTRRVRRRLGESLSSISETDPPLVQYTTSSWEALQLVAMGAKDWSAGHFPSAARNLELALEEDPDFAIARGSLGLLYIQFLGRADEGRQLLSEALESASEISRREYLLLRAVHRQFVDQDFEEALADYRMISEFYPDAAEPYNNSGRILYQLGRYEDAVRMYERARNVDPRSSIPVHNLWWVLIQNLRRPVAAEEAARTMVELEPESVWTQHSLGWTMVALRRFDEAETQMRKVLEIDPTHRYALANLAHLLYRRGAFEEAIEIYAPIHQQSHASEQMQSDVYDSLCLGLALQGADRRDEARDVLEAELNDLRAKVATGLPEGTDPGREACLLAALGRRPEALKRALEIEAALGDDSHGFFMVAEAYTLAGEPDRAITALERAMEAGYNDPYYILLNPPLHGIQDRPELEGLAPY